MSLGDDKGLQFPPQRGPRPGRHHAHLPQGRVTAREQGEGEGAAALHRRRESPSRRVRVRVLAHDG